MPVPYAPLSMPTMQTNDDGEVTFSNAADYISEAATAVNEAAQSFLTALADLGAIDITSTIGDLPQFNSLVWLGDSAAALQRPARPTMTLGNINDLLDALNQLSLPTVPTNTFNYVDPGYSSALRDPMINKLLTDLLNGGYGIDTNDEVALWARARDRVYRQMETNVIDIRRQAAATSAPMPQGAMYAALEKARQEAYGQINDTNREIALKRADLYVQHRQRTFENVLRSEEQSIALYNAIQARTLMAAEIKVRVAIAVFDAGIKHFTAKKEKLTTQIDAQLDSLRATIQVYAADVQSYAAFVNAVVSGAEVDIANSKNVLTRDIAAHDARVNIVKFRLQELMATLEKNKEIYKYGADFFRTALGSALNGINGLAVQSGEV